MPHSHLCLALRFCHLLQYSFRFGYIACRCICFAIIVFYVWNILSNLHTLLNYALSPPHSALIHHRLAMLIPPHPHPHRRTHTRQHHLLCPRSSRFCVDPSSACDASSSSSAPASASSPSSPSYPSTSLVPKSNLSSSVAGRRRRLAVRMASWSSLSSPSSS